MPVTSHPSCRTLSDELSRLWRLAVLSPGIPTKQHQGVIDQLRTLNQTGIVLFSVHLYVCTVHVLALRRLGLHQAKMPHLTGAYTGLHSIK